ncbi:MAG: FAD-dependent oxidoreductase [Nitrospinota bacterium]
MVKPRYRVRRLDSEYWFENVPCQSACPVGTEAGKYVTAIARSDYDEAARIASEPNPLAAICGVVCAHPCEKSCRRGNIDEPVAIRALKRTALESGIQKALNRSSGKEGKRIAIIGAGPAGLAAASELAKIGHQPVIFESSDRVGGMTAFGIPRYRLPMNVISENGKLILDNLSIELRTDVVIGRDILVNDLLKREGFSAVIAAVGAKLPRKIPLSGIDLQGVFQGIDFLMGVASEKEYEIVGKKVVVIGGGNVAMDAARSAVRLGPAEVHLVCMESRAEMPADKLEIKEALEEGVIFHNSKGPREIMGLKDVSGLKCVAVKSVFDQEGKFNPSFIEDEQVVLPADIIIMTIGQMPDDSWAKGLDGITFTRFGTPVIDKETLSTEVDGIFAAGDLATGPGIAISAVESGIRAARSVDAWFRGEKAVLKRKFRQEVVDYATNPEIDSIMRQEPVALLPEERRTNFNQVELAFDPDIAREQAKRCLNCSVSPVFNRETCLLCGGCVDVCPNSCLRLIRPEEAQIEEGTNTLPEAQSLEGKTLLIKDEEQCIRCGLCVSRCPVGAVSMAQFTFEKEWVYSAQDAGI